MLSLANSCCVYACDVSKLFQISCSLMCSRRLWGCGAELPRCGARCGSRNVPTPGWLDPSIRSRSPLRAPVSLGLAGKARSSKKTYEGLFCLCTITMSHMIDIRQFNTHAGLLTTVVLVCKLAFGPDTCGRLGFATELPSLGGLRGPTTARR